MAGLDVVEVDGAALAAGHHMGRVTRGEVWSRPASPEGFPLWMVVAHLGDGAEVDWPARHGDEVVYVEAGELELDDGRSCPTGGAVVIEADASASFRSAGPSRIVHAGPRSLDPPVGGINGQADPGGRNVHVVGPRGTWAVQAEDRDTHYYADSTCPTCRLTLLYTSRSAAYESPAHSHSQDELIHLLSGSIRLGNRVVGPGATLAIAADQRYAFVSDGGFAFINYRPDASEMTVDRSAPPRLEGGAANRLEPVMDLR